MKKLFFLLFISLCLISLVNAAPPIKSIITETGLVIEPTIKDCIEKNKSHEFEIHIFNKTNGYPITSGIGCYMHLYFKDGGHEYEGFDDVPAHIFDYAFDLNGANFTKKGMYQAKFQCNGTTAIGGGGEEIEFCVTELGNKPAGDILTSVIYFLFILTMLGSCVYLFMSILNMVTSTQTIFAVLNSWGFYLGLILTNYLSKIYLLDYFIENITANTITWGRYPLILIPLISLFLTMIKKGTDKKTPINPKELTGKFMGGRYD